MRWRTYWMSGLLIAALLVVCPSGLGYSPPQRSSTSEPIGEHSYLPHTLWHNTYGTKNDDGCHSLIHCRNGGYALIGWTSPQSGRCQVLMVRVDEDGGQQWNRTFGSPFGWTSGQGAAQTEDDGFAVFAGYYSPMIYPTFGGMCLIRLDNQGNHLWNKSYANPPTDGVQHMGCAFTLCRDGGFGLLGAAEDPGTGPSTPWVVRTHANGSILWNRVYRSSEPGTWSFGLGAAICECSGGGFALTGYTESEGVNAWLLRIDAEGNHLWNHTYRAAWLHGLIECSDGGFALAGFAVNEGLAVPPFAPIVIRTDSQGNTLWEYTYGGSGDEGFSAILEVEAGGFALAGHTNSSGDGDSDMLLMRIGPDGSQLWNLTVGDSADDWGLSLVRIPGAGFTVAGSTGSFGAGDLDMWLVRFAEPENTPPTWIEPPVDQTILFGVPFRYDLNATDSSGVSQWRLDDTAYFIIDDAGIIANATVLPVGSYSVRVVVYDIYNNALGGAFALMVLPTPLGVFIAILPFVLIVMLAASVVAIFGLRRYAYRK